MILRSNGIPLPDSRNALWEVAMSAPAWDVMVMVDDDIVLPEGAFPAFSKALETSDIAVMDYPHHYHELLSNPAHKGTGVTAWTQWLPGDSLEGKQVAWSGLGAAALKRATAEKIFRGLDGTVFRNTAHPLKTDSLGRILLTKTRDNGRSLMSDNYSGGEDTQFFLDAKNLLKLTVGLVPRLTASHLRLESSVSWIGNDKYSTSHVIRESSGINHPVNLMYHEDRENGQA
jgi:hypothetical protein